MFINPALRVSPLSPSFKHLRSSSKHLNMAPGSFYSSTKKKFCDLCNKYIDSRGYTNHRKGCQKDKAIEREWAKLQAKEDASRRGTTGLVRCEYLSFVLRPHYPNNNCTARKARRGAASASSPYPTARTVHRGTLYLLPYDTLNLIAVHRPPPRSRQCARRGSNDRCRSAVMYVTITLFKRFIRLNDFKY